MIYRVRARFRTDTAAAFLKKLTEGTIQGQIPDGPEIVASMNRAVLKQSGDVEWTELCYCPTPLQHERATVLDAHFDNLVAEPVQSHRRSDGVPFMDHLKQLAGAK